MTRSTNGGGRRKRDPRHDILFEPIQIGPKTMRNRFYQMPHGTGWAGRRQLTDAAYRGVRAEGGWAACCIEITAINAETDRQPLNLPSLMDEHDVALLAMTVDEIHRHDALAGVELYHAGIHARRSESRLPAVGPSPLMSERIAGGHLPPETPKMMDLDDIRRVQAEYVAAARLSREAGFDIVYAYAGHEYLVAQFLSPFYNKRTDEYGGSLENRARFLMEILDGVRSEVGDSCAIAVRLAVEGLGAGGLELSEGLDVVRLADDLVDLWDVNVGSWAQDSGSSRFFKEAWQLEWTGRVREATSKPIASVGRLTNPDQMADILRSGAWDIIGATRAAIADPFLPRKVELGEYDEIRECMGINACAGRSAAGLHIGCVQNATAGEEYRRAWHPERFSPARNADNDVLVVGAGPAGLECATVLGKRGMRRVHLVDASDQLGGCMRWIPQLPGLGQWARLVNHRRIQLDKLRNVQVVLNTRLEADEVIEYGAEYVIVATGSYWARDGLNAFTHEPIPGADPALAHVFTPEQVMIDGERPATGSHVTVYDAEGYFLASSIAEQLRTEGYAVDLVTPMSRVAPMCEETLEAGFLRARLHEIGVGMRPNVLIEVIEEGAIEGRAEFDEPISLKTDAVVLVTQRVADDALFADLRDRDADLSREGVKGLYRIGDCVSPRMLVDVVFDGHRLGREIDSDDPARPLPFRRERTLAAGFEQLRSEAAPVPG